MCRREAETADANMDITKGREVLPKNVKPLHYDLTLEPNLESFEYEGSVSIELDVVEDTQSITLNALELKIQEAKVTSGSSTISASSEVTVDDEKQTAKIDFTETIPSGSKATLHLKFTGTLNDKM